MLQRLVVLLALLVMGCGGTTAPGADNPITVDGTFDLTEFSLIDGAAADSAIFPLHAEEGSFLELTFNDSASTVVGQGLLIFNYWVGEIEVPEGEADSTRLFCFLGNLADNSVPGSTACVKPFEFEGSYSTRRGGLALFLDGDAALSWLDYRQSGIAYDVQDDEIIHSEASSDGSSLTIRFVRRQ